MKADNGVGFNLKELERRIDEALAKETKESLNSWLDKMREDDFN